MQPRAFLVVEDHAVGPFLYPDRMDLKTKQSERLKEIIGWAGRVRALQPILDAHAGRVHFRPGSKGFSMIGLLHDRPQLGKGGLQSPERLAKNFETMFAKHCRDIELGKVAGEKQLQSFLIRESYRHGRRLEPINVASKGTNEPVELTFVTDEIALPLARGKMVCDILALRRDGGRCTPVLLELKDSRLQSKLEQQVKEYSALVHEHRIDFAALFGALLGERIRFDGPPEKWIVWPSAGPGRDPKEDDLAGEGIRVVTYDKHKGRNGAYPLRVGGAPAKS